jgi:hypothetical protein
MPTQSAQHEPPARAKLASEVARLLAAAENERFEDGFDSSLSLELQRLVRRHGDATLEALSDLVLKEQVCPEVEAEALRCLGGMRDQPTYEARRLLLERALAGSSHVMRDGAVVGLSSLSDPRAIPAIEAAAERENYRLLRANMLELLEQLKGIQS